MALAALLGASLGVIGGVAAGARLFGGTKAPEAFRELDIAADHDDSIQVPDLEGKPVPSKFADVLQWTPEWTKWPDYERTMWLNHAIKTLWPVYNEAIAKMAMEQAKPQIDAALKGIPVVEAVDIELIDLGTHPLTIGGIKAYETNGEEVMIEVPVHWGSNMRVRVSARLGLAGYAVNIPVEVKDIQLKARARITLKPLVETIPCLGSVTISLLESPTVDLALMLINQLDIMAFPGLNLAANLVLKMVLSSMLIYPNQMSFPIMENGGVTPPPQGMLTVKVLRADKLKGGGALDKLDPFVELTVRDGRVTRTESVSNSTHPEFNEELQFLVDDPDTQAMSIIVKDDDAFQDQIIGVAQIPLAEAEFIVNPTLRVPVAVDLIKPESAGLLKFVGGGVQGVTKVGKAGGKTAVKVATLGMAGKDSKKDGESNQKESSKAPKEFGAVPALALQHLERLEADRGTVFLECFYQPFKAAGNAAAMPAPGAKNANMSLGISKKNLTADHKGVLTVTLIKCIDLDDGGEAEVDPFVTLTLDDPTNPEDETHTSPIIMNENSPRWNIKYDFVMVSATSTLTAVVWDKQGLFNGIMSVPKLLLGKKPQGKRRLGFFKVDVADVVANKRLSDTWALMDSEQGEIQLKLEWLPVQLEDL